jgi:hypothetical protein
MDMQALEVGGLIDPNTKKFAESVKFDFDSSGGILYMFWGSPTNKEIRNCQKGTASFSLVEVDGVLFFLSRFGDLKWQEAPYHVRLSQPFEVEKPTFTDGTGYALTVILVDADTGIIKALRMIGLPTGLSLKFIDAVERQLKESFNHAEYLSRVKGVYNRYSTMDLVKLSFDAPV